MTLKRKKSEKQTKKQPNKQADKIALQISKQCFRRFRSIEKTTNLKVILLPVIVGTSYHQQLSAQFIGICVSI